MGAVRGWLTVLAVVVLVVPAVGQSVISTHSGAIYYFEGSVYLNDQLLETHLGKFPSLPQGAELRTAQGRAEVLLTPVVFLPMGEKTSIRMLSNDLANTRVELERGSAIVDSSEADSGKGVTIPLQRLADPLGAGGDLPSGFRSAAIVGSEGQRRGVRRERAAARHRKNQTDRHGRVLAGEARD